MKTKLCLALATTLSLSAVAQTNPHPTVIVERTIESASPTFIFQVDVVSRSVQAVNYKYRSGNTKLDFAGTDLMTSASGEAKINSKASSVQVEAEFNNLQPPMSFGSEYLTYVLWSISPEGRAVNLGEILVGNDQRSKLRVTTDLPDRDR